jgi:hypothetical protein
MIFDLDSGLYLPTSDPDLDRRTAFLRRLGLHEEATPELDRLAVELGERAEQPWAMVNFITTQQDFAGLYVAPGQKPVERSMAAEHGYCPELLDRNVALILPDVCSHPRFQSNAVVDLLGVRTYSGAPMIFREAGKENLWLGSTCFIGPKKMPQETGQASRSLVKSIRDKAMKLIYDRAARYRR